MARIIGCAVVVSTALEQKSANLIIMTLASLLANATVAVSAFVSPSNNLSVIQKNEIYTLSDFIIQTKKKQNYGLH